MSVESPIITASLLRSASICARRAWLDQHGDPASCTELPPALLHQAALGFQHENRVQHALGPLEHIMIEDWDEGIAVTQELIAQGVPGIVGAFLEQTVPVDLTGQEFTLRGRVDRLLRHPDFSDPVYFPVEIKQRSQPEDSDWLQLDFYVWLLELTQGHALPGELWLGATANGTPRRRIIHDFDETRLLAALIEVAALLTTGVEPEIHLIPACTGCEWRAVCGPTAQRSRSIDLLYNVPRTTRANMRAAGLRTLDQIVAQTPEALQSIKGIGPKRAASMRANARAWIAERPIWLAALPEICRTPGWMFDLETREWRGKTIPWCMGWCDVHGSTHITLVGPEQHAVPSELPDGQQLTLVPDSDTAWEAFAAALAHDDAPVFHWTGYEVAILRGSAPPHIQAQLEPRLHDMHRSVTRTLSFPLKSTSIKAISAYLGFAWAGYDDWSLAFNDYMYWRETGELAALVRACAYQRADVQSMAHVWRWLIAQQEPITPE